MSQVAGTTCHVPDEQPPEWMGQAFPGVLDRRVLDQGSHWITGEEVTVRIGQTSSAHLGRCSTCSSRGPPSCTSTPWWAFASTQLWVPLHGWLTADSKANHRRLLDVRARAGLGFEVSALRVFDVLTWMTGNGYADPRPTVDDGGG